MRATSEDLVDFVFGDRFVRQSVLRAPNPAMLPPPAGEKRCYTCRDVKSTDDFYRRSYGRKGCMPNCKACHKRAVQRNAYQNP